MLLAHGCGHVFALPLRVVSTSEMSIKGTDIGRVPHRSRGFSRMCTSGLFMFHLASRPVLPRCGGVACGLI
jgi:hypothetical protein